MRDFMHDYYAGAFGEAKFGAALPVQMASSAANNLIKAARRVPLTPVDRQDIAGLAAELEVTAAALRSVIAQPAPTLLVAAE
jgi:hypothetical protein